MDEISPGFSERSDRGKKSRAKGVTFERVISKKLRRVWPDAKRLFGQAREGNENPDVGGTPFWLELGRGGNMSIHKKLEQAIHDSETSPSKEYGGKPPVAIVQHDGLNEVVVSMRLEDFLDLCACKEPPGALGTKHGKPREEARSAGANPPRPVRRGKTKAE
jgi:hypothetical protein